LTADNLHIEARHRAGVIDRHARELAEGLEYKNQARWEVAAAHLREAMKAKNAKTVDSARVPLYEVLLEVGKTRAADERLWAALQVFREAHELMEGDDTRRAAAQQEMAGVTFAIAEGDRDNGDLRRARMRYLKAYELAVTDLLKKQIEQRVKDVQDRLQRD
jgi:hypothetical protein